MNFFDGKLIKQNGKYAVELGGYVVELNDEKQAALAANNVEEQEITLGLRPDHITLEDGEGVDAVIDVHELMGSTVHLHVNTLGQDVVIIVSTMDMTGAEVAALSAGRKIKFGFHGNVCHLFSKETEINLEA